jgi:hypothetical protein
MQSILVFSKRIPVMKKTRAGRPLPMILLLIPFLYLVFAGPFGEPAQTILEVIYLCLLLGITVWVTNRNTDEVEVAAARFSASAGAFAGIVCTVGFLIVMTRVPAVAEFIATLAESPGTDLPPCHHWLWSGCDGGDLSHVYLRDHRVCDMVLAVNALKNSIPATSQV